MAPVGFDLGKRPNLRDRAMRTTNCHVPYVIDDIASRELLVHQFLSFCAQLGRVSRDRDDAVVWTSHNVMCSFAAKAGEAGEATEPTVQAQAQSPCGGHSFPPVPTRLTQSRIM
jgi:hypothetical protein